MRVNFNTAYNLPCVFNVFATCPLPPPQNRLDTRVEAGELNLRQPSSVDGSPFWHERRATNEIG
jgi:uncharacterized protein